MGGSGGGDPAPGRPPGPAGIRDGAAALVSRGRGPADPSQVGGQARVESGTPWGLKRVALVS